MTRSEPDDRSQDDSVSASIARGGLVAFSGRLFQRIFNVAFQVLMTRVLTLDAYGIYALGQTVFSLFNQLSLLGLNNGVVRFGAQHHSTGDHARFKGTIYSALALTALTGMVSGVVLFFTAGWIATAIFSDANLAPALRGFAFIVPLQSVLVVLLHATRAIKKMQYESVIFYAVQPILLFVGTGVAFLLGYRLSGAIGGFAFSIGVSVVLAYLSVRHAIPAMRSSVAPVFSFGTLIPYSLAVSWIGLSTMFLNQTDRIMVGIFRDPSQVALYTIAATIAFQLLILKHSLEAILGPTIAGLYHQGREDELARTYKTTVRWSFTLLLPVFLALVAVGQPLLRIAFGEAYQASYVPMLILAGSQLVNASTGPGTMMLAMTRFQKFEFMNGTTSALLNVGLNVWFIQRYGIVGAAIASGIALGCLGMARMIEIRILLHMNPFERADWKPFVAAAGAIGIWLLLTIWLGNDLVPALAKLVLAGLAYVGCLWGLGGETEDRAVLEMLRKRTRRTKRDH